MASAPPSVSELASKGLPDDKIFEVTAEYMVQTGNTIMVPEGSRPLRAAIKVFSVLLQEKFSDGVKSPEDLAAIGLVEQKLIEAIAHDQMDGIIRLVEKKELLGGIVYADANCVIG